MQSGTGSPITLRAKPFISPPSSSEDISGRCLTALARAKCCRLPLVWLRSSISSADSLPVQTDHKLQTDALCRPISVYLSASLRGRAVTIPLGGTHPSINRYRSLLNGLPKLPKRAVSAHPSVVLPFDISTSAYQGLIRQASIVSMLLSGYIPAKMLPYIFMCAGRFLQPLWSAKPGKPAERWLKPARRAPL